MPKLPRAHKPDVSHTACLDFRHQCLEDSGRKTPPKKPNLRTNLTIYHLPCAAVCLVQLQIETAVVHEVISGRGCHGVLAWKDARQGRQPSFTVPPQSALACPGPTSIGNLRRASASCSLEPTGGSDCSDLGLEDSGRRELLKTASGCCRTAWPDAHPFLWVASQMWQHDIQNATLKCHT